MQEKFAFGLFLSLISMEVKEKDQKAAARLDLLHCDRWKAARDETRMASKRKTARDLACHSCAIHFNFMLLE